MNYKDILLQMTATEKAGLLTGSDTWHIKNCPRLGMGAVMMSDGPHGLRKQNENGDNLGIYDSVESACFPSAAGMASSFNRDLLYRLGQTLGKVCQAEGIHILLGPGVNIKRSPLCGRNFEYFSEDPYIAGELAAAYINGVQGMGVGTSLKHFAANNQEYRRMLISSVVDERALREIYLPAFETAVKKAQPWTIMAAYNKLNGIHATEYDRLLNQILRKEWGFQGYVVTDWGASYDRVMGVKAGCDLEMPSSGARNTEKLMAALKQGALSEQELDTSAGRILEISQRCLDSRQTVASDREADHQAAREIARETMVLLKNEGEILPLSKKKKIAFIGAFAETPRYQGGGSSHINTKHVVSALQAVNGKVCVTYAKGYDIKSEAPDARLIQQAVEIARGADVAVVFAGLTDRIESEGYDRKNLDLPQAHNQLIEAVAAVQPNTVVVLHNGAPVLMPWLDKVKGVLEAYLGGEAVGEAVTDILFGDCNPSGRLAETFPKALTDTPSYGYFPGAPLTVEYRESIYVGYRYYDKAEKDVLFPFGYGLSYTQFAYSDLTVEQEEDKPCHYKVSFTVKNTGDYAGADVPQLYIVPPRTDTFRPVKELKGFEKVFLKPGEKQRIAISLDKRSFAYYHTGVQQWAVEDGTYLVQIGASSRDIRLSTAIAVHPEQDMPVPYTGERYPSYTSGNIQNVPDREFEQLLGTAIPPSHRCAGAPFTLDDCIQDGKDTKWGKRITRLLTKAAGERLACYVEAALTIPLCSMVGFMGEYPRQADAQAIVSLLNNEKVLSSLKTIGSGILQLRKKKG